MTLFSIDALLQPFGVNRSDLNGAALGGEIPLSNAVVNRFIAAQLARRDVPVSAVQLDAQADDTMLAHVVAKARFVPAIRIAARIERQPRFPDDPILWLRWSLPGMGALAVFAAPALAMFKALPPGVRAEGDRIGIDVKQALAARGLGEIADCLRDLRVHTRAGAFLVRFEIRVDGDASARQGTAV